MARRGAPRKDYITAEDLDILARLLAGDRRRKAKTEMAISIAAREQGNGNPVTAEAARKLLDLRWRERQQAIQEQAPKPAPTLVAVPRSPIWGGVGTLGRQGIGSALRMANDMRPLRAVEDALRAVEEARRWDVYNQAMGRAERPHERRMSEELAREQAISDALDQIRHLFLD